MQFWVKLFLKYILFLPDKYLKKVFVDSLLSLNVSKQNPQKNIKKNKNDTVDQRPL